MILWDAMLLLLKKNVCVLDVLLRIAEARALLERTKANVWKISMNIYSTITLRLKAKGRMKKREGGGYQQKVLFKAKRYKKHRTIRERYVRRSERR